MRPRSSSNRHRLLAGIAIQTVLWPAIAMADPPASPNDAVRIRTVRIRPPGRDGVASSTSAPETNRLTVLPVRPALPGEQRDPAGRPLTATPSAGPAASDDDRRPAHTLPIRPDPGAAPTPASAAAPRAVSGTITDTDHHVVRTIRITPPSAPQ
jgi:hypothetical protein